MIEQEFLSQCQNATDLIINHLPADIHWWQSGIGVVMVELIWPKIWLNVLSKVNMWYLLWWVLWYFHRTYISFMNVFCIYWHCCCQCWYKDFHCNWFVKCGSKSAYEISGDSFPCTLPVSAPSLSKMSKAIVKSILCGLPSSLRMTGDPVVLLYGWLALIKDGWGNHIVMEVLWL